MKGLVTGATGFVGRRLCERMMADGWQVLGAARSAEQAAKLTAGVEVVQIASIGADTDWSDALAGVDAVVHLAARVHVMNDTASDPLSAFRLVNVAGAERLARMAATNGVKRFVYISSVKMNGKVVMSLMQRMIHQHQRTHMQYLSGRLSRCCIGLPKILA